jgi:hypothetical protein
MNTTTVDFVYDTCKKYELDGIPVNSLIREWGYGFYQETRNTNEQGRDEVIFETNIIVHVIYSRIKIYLANTYNL